MQIGAYRFDRVEFAGSLGDLGTLIPLSVSLVLVNGLSFTSVFMMVGLFYLVSGLYYRLPIPVQPLKVVSAIAIAFPEKVTLPVMSATGLLFGVFLILLAVTGLINQIARLFTKPVVRGIQCGLGLILIKKGISFILRKPLFVTGTGKIMLLQGLPVNLLIGILSFFVVLLLLTSRRLPAALMVVAGGIAAGIGFGAFEQLKLHLGPTPLRFFTPASMTLLLHFFCWFCRRYP